MNNHHSQHDQSRSEPVATALACQSIDWFAEGEAKVVEVGGVRVVIRFIGRKGRRGRIAIEAPAGAVFQAIGRCWVNDRSS
jgi:hypothetical protein